MSAMNTISAENLFRLLGTPRSPAIVEVEPEGPPRDGRLIPTAVWRSHTAIPEWIPGIEGSDIVVVCADGRRYSPGVAAWLRQAGLKAETLAGGTQAWIAAGLPRVTIDRLPARDRTGSTVWVTRARPKVDRIACPWLIRRFIDRSARFLYVAPIEVRHVAEHLNATPFDVEGDGVFWSHRGEACTFDLMLQEFGLAEYEPLARLATIVRGADTGHLDLCPEAPGLLAASLGLSRMFADDMEQLESGMLLYDAFYRWCRDAVDEVHDWRSHKSPSPVRQP